MFSRFGKPENFRKIFAKEEEEEVQEDVQRDSKVVKEYVEKFFVKVASVIEMQIKVLLL